MRYLFAVPASVQISLDCFSINIVIPSILSSSISSSCTRILRIIYSTSNSRLSSNSVRSRSSSINDSRVPATIIICSSLIRREQCTKGILVSPSHRDVLVYNTIYTSTKFQLFKARVRRLYYLSAYETRENLNGSTSESRYIIAKYFS